MTVAKLIDRLSEFDSKIPVLFVVSSGPYGFKRAEITNKCEIFLNNKGSDEYPEIISVGIGVDLEEEQLNELQNAWY